MSRVFNARSRVVVLILFLSIGAAYFGIDALIRSDRFRLWAETETGQRFGLKIILGHLQLSGLGVSVQDLKVIKPSGLVLFECRRCDIGLDPLLPLTGRIRKVKLHGPTLRISSEEPSKPFSLPRLSFGSIEIEAGEVIFLRADSEPIPVRLPALRVRNLKLAEGERIQLSVVIPWLGASAKINAKLRLESPYIHEGEIRLEQGGLSHLKALLSKDGPQLEGRLKAAVRAAATDEGRFQARVNAEVNGLASPGLFSGFDGKLDLDTTLENGALKFELKFAATGLPQEIGSLRMPLPPGPVEIAVTGNSLLADKRIHFSKIEMKTPAGAASGRGNWRFPPGSALSLGFDLRKISLLPVQSLARGWVQRIRNDATVDGTAEISTAGSSFSITARLFSENPLTGPTQIPLFLSLRGGKPDKGSFSLSGLVIVLGKTLKEADQGTPPSGTRTLDALLDQRQIQELFEVVPALRDLKRNYPTMANSRIGGGSFRFQFPDGADGLKINGTIELKEIDARPLKVGALKMTLMDMAMPVGEKGNRDLNVNMTGLSLDQVAWSPAQGTSASLQRLTVAGMLTKRNAGVETRGTFRLSGGSFSSPDGRQAGEHLDLEGKFSFLEDQEAGTVRAGIEARVNALELLVGRFFTDLKGQDATLTMDGSYAQKQGRIDLKRLEARVPSIGRLSAHGELSQITGGAKKIGLRITAPEIDVGTAFRIFVQDTFKDSYPSLAGIRAQGKGSLSSELNVSSGNFSMQGELRLNDLDLGSKRGGLSLAPVDLVLPFKVGSKKEESKTTDGPRGSLRVGGGRWGKSQIASFVASPYLWNNRFGFERPIKTSLFDGSLQLSDIRGENVLKFSEGFSFSGSVEGINLQSLSEALGWPPLPGNITAHVPVVQWIGDKISAAGEITINIFKGTLQIGNLRIEEPLAPVPSLRMDVKMLGIDLSQASETLAFGRISGILEGSIRDLVIAGGQPSRFIADIHTTPRRGVSQTIDVEALNKVSILGGGGTGVLNTGIYRMFEHYRYQKIGFKGRLENDRLLLQGVESRDGKEYLVVGTFLPPTVNVVSHTQEVSFNELLKRIEGVKSSGPPKKIEEKR